jgi:hypothetical protein
MPTTAEDDVDDGLRQQNEGGHTANANTLLVPKMKEIAIYKLPHWTLWPAFAIFVFLASEGVRAQSASSRILLTERPTRKCAGLPASIYGSRNEDREMRRMFKVVPCIIYQESATNPS